MAGAGALGTVVGAVRWLIGEVRPEAEPPPGAVSSPTLEIGGFERRWVTYRPPTAPIGAPILFVLHGTGGNGADLRRDLGYRFDQLALEHGFVTVYPDGWQGNWNEPRRGGEFPAKAAGVDGSSQSGV